MMKPITKNLIRYLFFITFIITLSSCAGSRSTTNLDRAYQSSGMNQYILADLPKWAQFNETIGCFRKVPIKFLDVSALMRSFSLSFSQALEVQGAFNQSFLAIADKPLLKLTLTEEDRIFNEALQKVQNKIHYFEAPDFKTIHLVDYDFYLKTNKPISELVSFLKSNTHDSGVPVIVSGCSTTNEIKSLLGDLNYKVIGAELFSIYEISGEQVPSMNLILDGFFKNQQTLLFFTKQKDFKASHLKGKFKIIYY